jgi:serine/threonine protein kinase
MSFARSGKLARYKTVRMLGQGGMGKVLLAWDRNLKRMVAIKLLAQEGGISEEQSFRFAREARLQARVDHPNLVHIYDVQLDGPEPFLAMEHVHGRDLDQILKADGPLTSEALIRIAQEVGAALDCLHEHSIIHRDIKPANVMIRDQGGAAVLMDLGLAREMNATIFTRTGVFVGTPRFLPPEVARSLSWGPLGDQWQLAATLFALGTGTHLVRGKTLDELLSSLKTGSWSDLPEGIEFSGVFERALMKAASLEPFDRFADCQSFGLALAGEKCPKKASPDVPSLSRPRAKPASRRPSGVMVGLFIWILLVLALAGGRRWLQRPEPPRDIIWKVVGNCLQVRFLGDPRTQLVVDDKVSSVTCQNGGEVCQGLQQSLPSERSVKAFLSWAGQRSVILEFRSQPPAVHPEVHLGRDRSLRIRVMRKCTLMPLTGKGDGTLLSPGPHLLPLSEAPEGPLKLVWEEEGIRFHHILSFPRLLQETVTEIETLGEGGRMVSLARDQLDHKKLLLEEFLRLQSSWQEVRSWIPTLLDTDLPSLKRLQILRNWQTWRHVVEILHSLRLVKRSKWAQPLPVGASGSEFYYENDWEPVANLTPLLRPDRGADHDLERLHFRLGTPQLIKFRDAVDNQSAAKELRFLWPEVKLPAGRTLCVAVQADTLDQRAELSLETAEESFKVSFWKASSLPAWKGWILLVLPVSLFPRPGTPMVLRYLPFVSESVDWCKVRGVEIRQRIKASPR